MKQKNHTVGDGDGTKGRKKKKKNNPENGQIPSKPRHGNQTVWYC
jgi:hypothetical protein